MLKKTRAVYQFFYDNLAETYGDEDNSIHQYLKSVLKGTPTFEKNSQVITDLDAVIKALEERAESEITEAFLDGLKKENLRTFIFPENKVAPDEASISEIRDMRRLSEVQLCEPKIKDPYTEILIVSNIMLTMPKDFDSFRFESKDKIDRKQLQENWYDHPIPMDIADSSNEIIYGLKNLSEALAVETKAEMNVLLSVSTTHPTLDDIAFEYIEDKIAKLDLSNLCVYIMTEKECNAITSVLFPGNQEVKETFGVSGKYGRHYSFLRAVAPLFAQVTGQPIKAMFKIDLDQVFPQEALKEENGVYGLALFSNTRWGAEAIDTEGRPVKLGMIAGRLVNDCDMDKGLFYPDVPVPKEALTLEQYVFNSTRPQHVSSRAEMCYKYEKEDECIQRFHVTGGTNGILLEDLLAYRPFTPSFVARAEDQAFILSVFNKQVDGKYLRYYHADGLVMRHDKGTFLSDDLKAFAIPKMVGDYERVLIFSHYTRDILSIYDQVKKEMFPFTSAFIMENPHLAILMRMYAKLLTMDYKEGVTFAESFAPRISKLIDEIESGQLKESFAKERWAYDTYYDLIEAGLETDQRQALVAVFESVKLS